MCCFGLSWTVCWFINRTRVSHLQASRHLFSQLLCGKDGVPSEFQPCVLCAVLHKLGCLGRLCEREKRKNNEDSTYPPCTQVPCLLISPPRGTFMCPHRGPLWQADLSRAGRDKGVQVMAVPHSLQLLGTHFLTLWPGKWVFPRIFAFCICSTVPQVSLTSGQIQDIELGTKKLGNSPPYWSFFKFWLPSLHACSYLLFRVLR